MTVDARPALIPAMVSTVAGRILSCAEAILIERTNSLRVKERSIGNRLRFPDPESFR